MVNFGDMAVVELNLSHFGLGKRTVLFSELVEPIVEKCGFPEFPTPAENYIIEYEGCVSCVSCRWYA